MGGNMKTLKFFLIFLVAIASFADKKLDGLLFKKDYKQVIKYIETNYKVQDEETTYAYGFAHENLGFDEKAIACYLSLYRLYPSNCLVLTSLARVYCKIGLCERAYEFSSKCVQKDSITESYKLQHASICYKIRRYDEAQKWFEKIRTTKEAKEALGTIYYERKLYKQAIPYLLKQYSLKKDDAIALRLSLCYAALGQSDSSLLYLKTVNNISIEDRLKLARLYISKGQCQEAFVEYNKLQVQSFQYEDLTNQGKCLEEQKNISRALAFYEAATKKADAKQALQLKLKIAKIYMNLKDYVSVLKYVKEFEVLNAGLEYNRLIAQYYATTNDYAKIELYANKVLRVDSSAIPMYFLLIDAYEKQNYKTKAKKIAVRLSKQKDTPENALQLGDYYYENKNYDKAQKYYEKTYIFRENFDVLERIAICAFKQQDYDKAKDASETLLRKGAASNKCREIIYKIALDKKKYQKAIEQLEILVKFTPSLEQYKDLAVCYRETNRKEQLFVIDTKIVELDSKDIESRERLANSYYATEKNAQALKHYYELEKLRVFNVTDYFKIVTLLGKAKDNQNSIVYLKKILNLDAQNVDAHKKLADVYFKLKDYDNAYLEYNKTMTLAYSRIDYLKNFSYVVIIKKNVSEIIRICNRALVTKQADSLVIISLANTYYDMGSYTKALNVYNKLQQEKITAPIILKIAICQERTGAISNAIASYEQYVNLVQTAKNEYFNLAALYLKQGKKDLEMSTYKSYLAKYKNDKLSLKVGVYSYEKEDYKSAVKYFALANIIGNADQSFIYGRALFMTKEYDNAISILTMCTKFNSYSRIAEVYRLIAVSHENLKNIEKAIKFYKLYCQINTRDSTYFYHMGRLQEQLHVNLAKDIYVANTKRFYYDYRNYERLSGIYFKLGDYKRAQYNFEKTKALKDTISVDMLSKLAYCYKQNGNRVLEIKTYKEILGRDSKNFNANKELGIYCYEVGELHESLAYLRMAKAQNNSDPDMLYILGKIYLKDAYSSEGFEFLQTAKQQKSKDTTIRLYLIDSYKRFSKYNEAKNETEQLLAINRSFTNLDIYAKILYQLKDYAGAENIAVEMRKKEPQDINLMMFLAQIKIEQGNLDDALEYCKMVSYVDSRYAPAICKRADIYMLKKDNETAREYYNKAISIDPKYAMSYYGLGMICKFNGEIKTYTEYITKAVALDSTNTIIAEELKRTK